MTREEAIQNAVAITDGTGYETVVVKLWRGGAEDPVGVWGSWLATDLDAVQAQLAKNGMASAVSLRIRAN